MDGPMIVKRGSAIVKIYRTPSVEKERFMVVYWLNGERNRVAFVDPAKAKAEADAVANQLTSGDLDVGVASATVRER